MRLAIDASNLLEGGGVTHIVELLRNADPVKYGFERVIIWSSESTLDRLENRSWLVRRKSSELDGGYIKRAYWQRYILPRVAASEGCDILFAPGGLLTSKYKPAVTMCRNMLPFDDKIIEKYGLTWRRLRLVLLRNLQSRSFRRADGVIFLTKYAHDKVLGMIGNVEGVIKIIPHGVGKEFLIKERVVRPISMATYDNPLRLVYVSHASPYKHQWRVISAVAGLRTKEGWPLQLDLIGPLSVSKSVKMIESAIKIHDPRREWVYLHGPLPRNDVQKYLRNADIGIYASSCENMPNILLEKMASGLPIACSNHGPMPEILRNAGVYFNPEDHSDIAQALKLLISAVDLRKKLSDEARALSFQYTWERCADETFEFLSSVARGLRKNENHDLTQ